MKLGVRKHFRTVYKVQLADAPPSDCPSQGLPTWTRAGRSRGYSRWLQRAAERSGVEARLLHYFGRHTELIMAVLANHNLHPWH